LSAITPAIFVFALDEAGRDTLVVIVATERT
jgi:hypothetical protein